MPHVYSETIDVLSGSGDLLRFVSNIQGAGLVTFFFKYMIEAGGQDAA